MFSGELDAGLQAVLGDPRVLQVPTATHRVGCVSVERHPALSNCLVEYMLDTDDMQADCVPADLPLVRRSALCVGWSVRF